MTNFLAALAAWFLFSFPLALLAGLVMRRAGRAMPAPMSLDDQARHDQARRHRALAAWAEHELGQLRRELERVR